MTRRKLTPAEIERQQANSTRLAPGFWVDADGALHVSIPELLALVGLPETPENIEAVGAMARKLAARQWPDTEIIEQE